MNFLYLFGKFTLLVDRAICTRASSLSFFILPTDSAVSGRALRREVFSSGVLLFGVESGILLVERTPAVCRAFVEGVDANASSDYQCFFLFFCKFLLELLRRNAYQLCNLQGFSLRRNYCYDLIVPLLRFAIKMDFGFSVMSGITAF